MDEVSDSSDEEISDFSHEERLIPESLPFSSHKELSNSSYNTYEDIISNSSQAELSRSSHEEALGHPH